MSMVLYLRKATEIDVSQLQSPAPIVPDRTQTDQRKGVVSRFFGSSPPLADAPFQNGDQVQDFFFSDPDSGNVIDFDRSWDALNFMLTGEAFGNEGPLAIFYYPGDEVGPDSGYGPARYIPKEKMAEFCAALKNLSDEDIASRFNPVAFEQGQIYSSYLFSEDGIDIDYIMQWVPALRKFASECSDGNSGALVAIY